MIPFAPRMTNRTTTHWPAGHGLIETMSRAPATCSSEAATGSKWSDMDGNRVDRVLVNRIDPNRTVNVPTKADAARLGKRDDPQGAERLEPGRNETNALT